MKIKLYGASDDILEIIENGHHREVYVEQSTITLTCSSKTGSIWITAIYNGSWAFAIGSNDSESDYYKMPPDIDVTRTWGVDTGYSETIVLSGENLKLRIMED